jgi:hypothetical protein
MNERYIGRPEGMKRPERERLAETWGVALYLWDYCDPEPLAKLVRAEPIPGVFREAVAAIITGVRAPKKKAAAKLKIPAAERRKVVRELTASRIFREFEKQVAASTATRRSMEPIEVIQGANEAYHAKIEGMVEQYGVSKEIIENLARTLKDYLTF